ncbi:unnamed protein product [Bursaphelenchus okinawaensis]|uniref:Uncharacterized protein n=1 Tax=Bursaphelenchus okinawaensis TaxID=465554 RepID=A0A811LK09_9BILA|nr:unnamed protein product [Bursaphelenchus okinawaensis]CAG9127333.1 unnamed protein product [Bursaphelenchus okinawaensis]
MFTSTLLPESRRILIEHQLWSEFTNTEDVPSIKYKHFDEPLIEVNAKYFDAKRLAFLASVNKKYQRMCNVYLSKFIFEVIANGNDESSAHIVLQNKNHTIYCAFNDLKVLRTAGLLKWKPHSLQIFHDFSFPEWTIYTSEFTELEQLSIVPVHPANPELKSILNNATQLITNSAKTLQKLRCNQAILKHTNFPAISLKYCGSPVLRINGKIYGIRPPKSEDLSDSQTQFSLLGRTREVDEVRPVETLFARNIEDFDLEAHSYSTFSQLRQDFKLNPNIKMLKFGWESDEPNKTGRIISTIENHSKTVEEIIFNDTQVTPSHLKDFDYTQLLKYAKKFKDYTEMVANSSIKIQFQVDFWLIQTKQHFLRFQHENGLYSKQIAINYNNTGLTVTWYGNNYSVNLNEFDDHDLSRKVQVFENTLKSSVDAKNIPNGPFKPNYL